MPSDGPDLNAESRHAWEVNASYWDERMADGNDFQRMLVGPATERLLDLRPGEVILEAACGNGVMARRLAEIGAKVIAFDFSAPMIETARARGTADGAIEYKVVDATDESAIVALGERVFDAAVCNMALMDMAEIKPLMGGIAAALKPEGRFVFSLCHPCFNNSACARVVEETDEGEVVTLHSVKVFRYTHGRPTKGLAMRGQPEPQIYFNRTITEIFAACFEAGMVITGIDEPVFPPSDDQLAWTHWNLFAEMPAVLVVKTELR